MQILEGKILSDELIEELKTTIDSHNLDLQLAIIQVGDEKASEVYISNKQKLALRLGIQVSVYKFQSNEEDKILSTIDYLNKDETVDGIIVQLPTPGLLNSNVLESIDPKKDVDGLTSHNLGKVWHDGEVFSLGATPRAILFILEKIALSLGSTIQEYLLGKKILIINHSILIGKPLAGMLSFYNATPILANKATRDLDELLKQADIVVSATGSQTINSSNSSLLKQDVVLIDSGYRYHDGKTTGDIELNSVTEKASFATTVPGGIGPIGVAMLMKNVVDRKTRYY